MNDIHRSVHPAPVLAIVVNLVIVIAGLQAWRSLNVRQYPRSENATIMIATAYVGASAELVRGFITTPLERVDRLGRRHRLHRVAEPAGPVDDHRAPEAELRRRPRRWRTSARKVNQVRNDLPPEAEVPAISVQSADRQFASPYLSFASTVLSDRPRSPTTWSAWSSRAWPRSRACSAPTSWAARTFAMRVWLKPERMAALNVSPAQVRAGAGGEQLSRGRRQTKGALVQVNLTANTDLHSVAEFQQLVVRREGDTIVRLRDVADVVLGAEDYDTEVRIPARRAVFMGIFPLPNANTIDVVQRVRAEIDEIKQRAADRADRAASPTTPPNTSANAIHEVVQTLVDTLLIVIVVIFLFLGSLRSVLVPVVAIPVSLIGAHVPDAGVRLHAEPADAAGDRAVGRAGGRRRDRRGRERRAPSARRPQVRSSRAARGARAGRARSSR